MTNKAKMQSINCIKLKETLQKNMWKKSKAANIEEYIIWLKSEHVKTAQEWQKRSVDEGVTDTENP